MTVLEAIVDAFGTPEAPRNRSISRDQVREWLQCPDIDVQGALYTYLLDERYADRIVPKLEFSDLHPFVAKYLLRCIEEDPDGDWIEGRYPAGLALAHWFVALVRDASVSRDVLRDIRQLMAQSYLAGDTETRNGLVNGALEHIFEDPSSREHFRDWEGNPHLAEAYALAKDWAESS